VLVLHSYHTGYEWTDSLDAAIRRRLQESPYEFDIRVEHMDTKRHASAAHLDRFAAFFASKYGAHHFDVVIVTDDAALDFAVKHHRSLLHGAKVVFCGVGDPARAHSVPRDSFTGIVERFDFSGILQAALALHPGRRQVLVIGDNTNVGEVTLRNAAEIASRRPDLEFHYLDGKAVAFRDILATVRRSGDQTVVMASAFVLDRDGTYYPRDEANRLIAAASPAPVYSPSVSQLGQGIVGGSKNSGTTDGRLVAQLALDVLQGRPPARIPITEELNEEPVYDDRQLSRWKIDRTKLPANAEIVNRPEPVVDFYTRYRPWLLGGLAFTVFQTGVIGALVVAVTRRRRAEARIQQQAEALRSANQDLARANASLHSEIGERLRAEAEKEQLNLQLIQSQKMEAIGKLAGGVAHDFNNLLSVILGHVEFALDALPVESPLAGDLREVQTAGNRAATLTRQLLAFSRKQFLQPTLVDLNEVTARIEAMLRRIIGQDVCLVRVCDAGLGLVRADEAQVEQVLLNLVINARDAMPDGGQITIETAHADVTQDQITVIGVPKPGRYVRVSVTDTGIGMDEDTLSHAFEPFFTTKAAGRGTGLGLSMAYGIVKQSGGGIVVDSRPGDGARFDVYLPLHTE
jgi:signal transduction histidine kinase